MPQSPKASTSHPSQRAADRETNPAANTSIDTSLLRSDERATVARGPVLDPAALYGVAGDIVRQLQPHTEAHPAALLFQLLAFLGNQFDGKPYVMVDNQRHPPKLFVAVVGRTAKARKGTSLARVEQVMGAVDPYYATRVEKGMQSGEALVTTAVSRAETAKAKDGDLAGAAFVLVEPEFARVLKVAGRQGNILGELVRDLWDSTSIQTRTKKEFLQAKSVHLSIVGHCTLDELRKTLTKTDHSNGFSNRFLWVHSERQRPLPNPSNPPADDMEPLFEALKGAIRHGRALTEVPLSTKAKTLWEDIYVELSADHPGPVNAIICRSEPQVLRLALTYALIDGSEAIRTQHLKAARAAWQYAEDSAKFIFEGMGMGGLEAQIMGALKSAPAGLTKTMINRALHGHFRKEDIRLALDSLNEAGLATWTTSRTAGRPVERWTATRSHGQE